MLYVALKQLGLSVASTVVVLEGNFYFCVCLCCALIERRLHRKLNLLVTTRFGNFSTKLHIYDVLFVLCMDVKACLEVLLILCEAAGSCLEVEFHRERDREKKKDKREGESP